MAELPNCSKKSYPANMKFTRLKPTFGLFAYRKLHGATRQRGLKIKTGGFWPPAKNLKDYVD
jgi:hypothetical protein